MQCKTASQPTHNTSVFYLRVQLKELYLPGLIKEMELEYNEIVKYRQTVNLLVPYSHFVLQMLTNTGVMCASFSLDLTNHPYNNSHLILLQVDETVECPLYMERAEDGMDIILARLISVLDSWISFEDNVMMEMDAAEAASQRIMEGSVGEVGLVTDTSETLLGGMIETTGEASDTAHRIIDNILNQWREDEQFTGVLNQFPDDFVEEEEY